MHTSMAVFAESAKTRSDGKLDVTGVHNCRFVTELPTKLDLTFVVFPLTPGPFEALELLEDPYVLAVPTDSELARRPSPVAPLSASFRSCTTRAFSNRSLPFWESLAITFSKARSTSSAGTSMVSATWLPGSASREMASWLVSGAATVGF